MWEPKQHINVVNSCGTPFDGGSLPILDEAKHPSVMDKVVEITDALFTSS